ncbi:hypothetical protein E3N88_00756 [Mikania micrantha]|uniref:Thioredoxin domain-containing protein n=1 Tax=Mikania micrantha TaxID=192012 RepID=A0A5N6Q1Q0_9ASTR|nr:hypothetical protein E3N88_00756 [Mikania micrantha]
MTTTTFPPLNQLAASTTATTATVVYEGSNSSCVAGWRLGFSHVVRRPYSFSGGIKMSISIDKSLRWWEKRIQPSMKAIIDGEDLVESLFKACDKLVVVDFFSRGCGGCKALHPKRPQFRHCVAEEKSHKQKKMAVNWFEE